MPGVAQTSLATAQSNNSVHVTAKDMVCSTVVQATPADQSASYCQSALLDTTAVHKWRPVVDNLAPATGSSNSVGKLEDLAGQERPQRRCSLAPSFHFLFHLSLN